MSGSQVYVADPDVILIGSGIMSANLGVMPKRLDPRIKIQVFEITDELAAGRHTDLLFSLRPRNISVSVHIACELIRKCFLKLLEPSVGRERMKEMLPTFDEDLKQPAQAALFRKVSGNVEAILQLAPPFDQ
ncbi:MAG: malate:quinone oxidoreductase [Aureliella sp.]